MKRHTNFNDMFNDPEYFPPEEKEAVNLEAAIISKIVEAREESGVSQRELASISGVKQTAISRMETMKTMPQLDTMLKVLVPLGYTLEVVPLRKSSV